MATTTQNPKRSFRPWPANQFVLERAEKVGFNVSELLNEIVSKHLKAHMVRKSAAQMKATRTIQPLKLAPKSRR